MAPNSISLCNYDDAEIASSISKGKSLSKDSWFEKSLNNLERNFLLGRRESFQEADVRAEKSLNNQKNNISLERRVSFQEVEVREYELDLCDNPACSLGPAIGIGWAYQLSSKEPLDDFEEKRLPKRAESDFKLNREQRVILLEKSRFTKKEIIGCMQNKAKIAYGRESTAVHLPFAHYEETLESAQRKLKQIIFRKKKDADLKQIWPEYEEAVRRESMNGKSVKFSNLVLHANA